VSEEPKPHPEDETTSAWPFFSLCSLGIAQPLLEQLGGNPEFFVVKRSGPVDILLLPFLLCVGIPGIILLLIRVAGHIHRKLAPGIHTFFVFILIVNFVLVGLVRSLPVRGIYILSMAALLSVFAAWGYSRFKSIRMSFRFMAISLVIVPVLFFSKPPIIRLLIAKKVLMPNIRVTSNTPVVMVILDELPLRSLVNRQNEIDMELFPNLAEFSKHATWFRNASSVSSVTPLAVPAILSGKYPKEGLIPTFFDYPKNIFTMLKNSYELKVFESATRLCPVDMPQSRMNPHHNLITRIWLTLKDLSAVYLHMITPFEWSRILPPVMQDWGNFWAGPLGRVEGFQDFINSLKPASKPALYFLHSGFPHHPWNTFPSLERQERLRTIILRKGLLPDNSMRTDIEHHLLQICFTDELIGQLLARMKTLGLFDRSLIVITADHGFSLQPGGNGRTVTNSNYTEIMLVPLIIKTPYQKLGSVSDRNAETIDILPTIAQVLGVSTPWSDGSSLLNSSSPERSKKLFFVAGSGLFLEFKPNMFPLIHN